MRLLPYYFIVTPQWNEVTYPGEVVQTTYTGQPPLPPQTTAAYVPKGIRPAATVPAPSPTAGLGHPVTTTVTTTRGMIIRPPSAAPRVAPATRPVTTRMR